MPTVEMGFRLVVLVLTCNAAKELVSRKKGTSSYMNPVAIFLISLSDKDFEFPNFQIPPTLAWRVSRVLRNRSVVAVEKGA